VPRNLPGVVAAHTTLPVIGFLTGQVYRLMDGIRCFLLCQRCLGHFRVATVGVDAGQNAAFFRSKYGAVEGRLLQSI
jgi:phosphoribosylcarboxyaminoimidazole (NCAIR) mutase